MTKKTNKSNNVTTASKRDTHGNNSTLDSQYGSIGISAVAAAVQFKGAAKKPACSPSSTGDEEKNSHLAA